MKPTPRILAVSPPDLAPLLAASALIAPVAASVLQLRADPRP